MCLLASRFFKSPRSNFLQEAAVFVIFRSPQNRHTQKKVIDLEIDLLMRTAVVAYCASLCPDETWVGNGKARPRS